MFAILRPETGSVSPAFGALLFCVLTLTMAFLDREWANYTIQVVEQTADLAAEAASRTHEIHTTITVRRYREELHWYSLCLDPVPLAQCPPEKVIHYPVRYRPPAETVDLGPMREEELLTTWRDLAECPAGRTDPLDGWMCESVTDIDRMVIFPSNAETVARETFRQNWDDRPAARTAITNVSFGHDGSNRYRSVNIHIDLQIESPFGLIRWGRIRHIVGSTVVVLPTVQFL